VSNLPDPSSEHRPASRPRKASWRARCSRQSPEELLRSRLPTSREPPKRPTDLRRADSKRPLNPFPGELVLEHRLRKDDTRTVPHPSPDPPKHPRSREPCTRSPKRPCTGYHAIRGYPGAFSERSAFDWSRRTRRKTARSHPSSEAHTSSPSLGFPPLRRLSDVGSDLVPGLPHPALLRLQVFSTS
jgi:hypothetical protein